MGVQRRTSKKSGSRVKTRKARTVVRRAGMYGTYRGTKNVANVRNVARRIGRALNPFPDTKLVRHKYADTISLPAAAAGVGSFYQFRANSTFDPDFTGVGHQPMFRDEMAAQYKYYTVMSAKIKIIIPAAATEQQTIALFADSDTSTPVDLNALNEQHRCYNSVKLDKRQSPLTLKGWYDAALWNKCSRSALLADDEKKASAGVNPAAKSTVYWTIARYETGGAALTAINARVEITQICLWRDPLDHLGS